MPVFTSLWRERLFHAFGAAMLNARSPLQPKAWDENFVVGGRSKCRLGHMRSAAGCSMSLTQSGVLQTTAVHQ